MEQITNTATCKSWPAFEFSAMIGGRHYRIMFGQSHTFDTTDPRFEFDAPCKYAQLAGEDTPGEFLNHLVELSDFIGIAVEKIRQAMHNSDGVRVRAERLTTYNALDNELTRISAGALKNAPPFVTPPNNRDLDLNLRVALNKTMPKEVVTAPAQQQINPNLQAYRQGNRNQYEEKRHQDGAQVSEKAKWQAEVGVSDTLKSLGFSGNEPAWGVGAKKSL